MILHVIKHYDVVPYYVLVQRNKIGNNKIENIQTSSTSKKKFPETKEFSNSLHDTSFSPTERTLTIISFSQTDSKIATESKDIPFVLPQSLHNIFYRSIFLKLSHHIHSTAVSGPAHSGIELPLDVSSFYHQLFCLKRDYSLSNLPSVEAIRVITTSKGDKAKVAEVNLFNPRGEVYLLELWNMDAIEGVKFLWEKLGSENEVMLRITDLDPSEPIKDRRFPVYKLCNPTQYQKEFKMFPLAYRIMVKNGSKDTYNDLSRQFRKIEKRSQIQLMNGNEVIRDISLWHQTPEAQEEFDHPDELQQLIYKATALSVLGKRTATTEIAVYNNDSGEHEGTKPVGVNKKSKNTTAPKKKGVKLIANVTDEADDNEEEEEPNVKNEDTPDNVKKEK